MKRGIILALSLICLSPLILGLSGVSPASYSVDFEPNLKQEFTFTFTFDKGLDIEAYINEGPISQYVTIKNQEDKLDKIIVTVALELPSNIKIPGLHRIRIGTRIKPSEKQGVSIITDSGGIIKLRVPYPGKYAEILLSTTFANTGDDVSYTLKVNSRGEENIYIKPKLDIKDINNNLINTINLEERTIKSKEEHIYEGLIKTTNYQPGDYNLIATVEFGGDRETTQTTLFRLGELKIKLINYTKKMEAKKLNRFKLEIESLWNDPIPEVYAIIKVLDYPEKISQTPSLTIKPWEKTNLVGFIDTSKIKSKNIKIEIEIFYAGKTTKEVVEVEIIKEISLMFISITIASILVLSLIVIIILLLKYKK